MAKLWVFRYHDLEDGDFFRLYDIVIN